MSLSNVEMYIGDFWSCVIELPCSSMKLLDERGKIFIEKIK